MDSENKMKEDRYWYVDEENPCMCDLQNIEQSFWEATHNGSLLFPISKATIQNGSVDSSTEQIE